MRIGRILGILVGGILALFAAVLLAVWLLVNPNAYKGRIAAAVLESTGRDLTLTGDIKLKLFPRIALELGPASLGNPPGFGAEPFLKFNRASVQVKLLPLLSKQLEMAGVAVDGLDLRMRKNAQGKGNWQGFGDAKASTPRTGTSVDINQALHNLAGIKVTNGRVSYQDIVIDKFNFESGAYTDRGIIPITLGFDAALGAPGANATVNA
ncbi:MAG: AsmA family protein, partial [Pseudomonadota bacterium]|nr:AsmA family protein [Pseudomonadota bacterium]